MKVSSHRPDLKRGDLIHVHRPQLHKDDPPEVRGSAIIVGPTGGVVYGDPLDAWINILIEGEIREIHVDYIKEMIGESR